MHPNQAAQIFLFKGLWNIIVPRVYFYVANMYNVSSNILKTSIKKSTYVYYQILSLINATCSSDGDHDVHLNTYVQHRMVSLGYLTHLWLNLFKYFYLDSYKLKGTTVLLLDSFKY